MQPEPLDSLRVCLVESNAALRRDLVGALERAGFRVESHPDARTARREAACVRPSIRVLDAGAPGVADWLEAEEGCESATILLAGDTVLPPLALGGPACGFEILYKPFSLAELESRILARIESGSPRGLDLHDPILESREPQLIELLARARRLARGSVPVCLVGELGTGRRALARQLHLWSTRRALPSSTLETASLEALGLARVDEVVAEALAHAAGGSLLIVEPAEQRPLVQEALLAALRSAGEDGPRPISIARRPLEQSAREGRLLVELHYRLDVAALALPPLRERPLDHLSLCQSLARRIARELGEPTPRVDEAWVAELARDGFPGNRLGLESRLRSALIQGRGGGGSLAAAGPTGSACFERAREAASLNLKALERDTIIRALAHWKGNRTRASESLGISVRTLRNKIREYGLR